jgi:hypothetical protein
MSNLYKESVERAHNRSSVISNLDKKYGSQQTNIKKSTNIVKTNNNNNNNNNSNVSINSNNNSSQNDNNIEIKSNNKLTDIIQVFQTVIDDTTEKMNKTFTDTLHGKSIVLSKEISNGGAKTAKALARAISLR